MNFTANELILPQILVGIEFVALIIFILFQIGKTILRKAQENG